MVYHRNIHHSYWLLYVLLAYFTCPKIRFLSSQEFTLHSINGKRYVYSLMFICIRIPSWTHALSSDTRTDCRLRQADSADSTTTCVFKTLQRHDQSEEEVVHLPTVSKHNFWIRNTNRLQEKRHKGVLMLKPPLNIIGWAYQRKMSSPATTRNVLAG